MTMSADRKTVTIVLGTYSANNSLPVGQGTEATAGTMVWTPTAGPEDLAGNPLATPITTATESGGTGDREFRGASMPASTFCSLRNHYRSRALGTALTIPPNFVLIV